MGISRATFDFLRALRDNNNREWFSQNKEMYQAAYENVVAFIQELIVGLSEFDPQIHPGIEAKKCLFRIYRDVRFSKDKSPYKSWFAAGISIDGRKLEGPEYYIHLEPDGRSFIAAGYWRPKKEHLDLVRQEIDYGYGDLLEALSMGQWTVDDLSAEDKLVRPPAGYAMDNEAIEVLKLKSFVLFHPLQDGQVLKAFALQDMLQVYRRSLPFKDFLHRAISV